MFETRDLFEQQDLLKKEVIKTPTGEVQYYPKRGGLITSIKFSGTEILYLDEATLVNPQVNVKGGVPILFPNAGPVESAQFPNLKQHGFARNTKWQSVHAEDGFTQTVSADASTKEMFPYDFKLVIDGKFSSDGSFVITQSVQNTNKETSMPVSMGLHPYFRVADADKKNIQFNFSGGEIVAEEVEKWANGKPIKAVSIPNPNTPMEVTIPGIGALVFEVSPEYQRIWVWSQTGKDFICIEPVMRDTGGLVDDPALVAPGNTLTAEFKITLKK